MEGGRLLTQEGDRGGGGWQKGVEGTRKGEKKKDGKKNESREAEKKKRNEYRLIRKATEKARVAS
jgi:hypothetical protein